MTTSPRPTAAESQILCWRRAFPGHESELGQMRRWLTWMLPECTARDDVIAVATELSANAIQHSASGRGGTFTVEVCWRGGLVRLTVADSGGRTRPHLINEPMSEQGRGLVIVSSLSLRAGTCRDHGRRLVWAEVPWTGPSSEPPMGFP